MIEPTTTPIGMRRPLLGLCFGLAALAAGCGGGGDAAAPAQAPTLGPAPAPAPAADTTCALPDFAASALARINQLRAAGATCGANGSFAPAGALASNALLAQAAEAHTRDMVANNFFSHTGSDGSTLGGRVSATGYAWSGVGENIAAGYPTVNAVLDGWMASDGHCANLMNPSFSEIGLSCVPGTSSDTYGNYWTMDLAKPR
jgi:uncharacterized protein YkwD